MAALIRVLGYSKAAIRKNAAQVLGQLGDTRVVDHFIAALKDDDSDVRLGVVWALGQFGDVQAVDPLIAALKENDNEAFAF